MEIAERDIHIFQIEDAIKGKRNLLSSKEKRIK